MATAYLLMGGWPGEVALAIHEPMVEVVPVDRPREGVVFFVVRLEVAAVVIVRLRHRVCMAGLGELGRRQEPAGPLPP